MMIQLVEEEGLGAGQTLVELMVEDVQQTQAVNNPYGSLDEKEDPVLYEQFRGNWYAGYAGGFLAKTAIGGAASSSAKATVKSTDTAQSAASKLSDTKALKALNRVSDAKEAAKGRATARILLAVDGDASEALLSQADTAGEAYRLWRHQRAMDADVDALPETKQSDLSRLLSRTGSDGQQTYDDLAAVDSDAADALLKIDDPNTQYRFVRAHQNGKLDTNELSTVVKRYDDLDPDEKVLAQRSIARSGDDGVRLLEIGVCNSPCDSLLESVDDFADNQGLTTSEKDKLVDAFEDSDGVPDDVPGGDPQTVYQDLKFLNDKDTDNSNDINVDELNGALEDISGDRKGYTGLAGEARIAKQVVENDNKADVKFRKKVGSENIDDDDIPDELNPKKDLKQVEENPTDIDVNQKNGPAYESKNARDFKPLYEHESAYESVGENLNELRKKLNTLAASGQDEIVVVMRKDQLNAEYGDEVTKHFPDPVRNIDKASDEGLKPSDLADEVEDTFDDVSVEFKSYDEVKK